MAAWTCQVVAANAFDINRVTKNVKTGWAKTSERIRAKSMVTGEFAVSGDPVGVFDRKSSPAIWACGLGE